MRSLKQRMNKYSTSITLSELSREQLEGLKQTLKTPTRSEVIAIALDRLAQQEEKRRKNNG